MGRELKRVPLSFDWPIGKTWAGYLNPHYEGHCGNCEHCQGSGSSPQAIMLRDLWYGHMPFHPAINVSEPFTPDTPQVRRFAERNVSSAPDYYGGSGEDTILRECSRLCGLFNRAWNHHLTQEDVDALWKSGRLKHDFKKKPKARDVNLWSIVGFGHDSINQWIVSKSRFKANRWPTECAFCKGSGSVWDSPESKRKAERWTRKEPPKGEGYQLWETVSEGSPISPVFGTPEELAEWLTESPEYKWKENDAGTTKDQWLRFINGPGWAPSMISNGTGLMTGVQAVSNRNLEA
jgi:hypothetical protein